MSQKRKIIKCPQSHFPLSISKKMTLPCEYENSWPKSKVKSWMFNSDKTINVNPEHYSRTRNGSDSWLLCLSVLFTFPCVYKPWDHVLEIPQRWVWERKWGLGRYQAKFKITAQIQTFSAAAKILYWIGLWMFLNLWKLQSKSC